jgi:tRNA threonylcarbamoyladenosine biosynthesis protein TsaE
MAKNESDTEHLASQLAPQLRSGMIITLDGDLGAGKTRFVQAIAQQLGITSIVSSPTFTIIREYDEGSLPIYHMDMYRLQVSDASELGLDDYFYGDGISFVEWSSRIVDILPSERLAIHIENVGNQMRRFQAIAYGIRYEEMCERLKRNGTWI